jgi:hypothetical protein
MMREYGLSEIWVILTGGKRVRVVVGDICWNVKKEKYFDDRFMQIDMKQ